MGTFSDTLRLCDMAGGVLNQVLDPKLDIKAEAYVNNNNAIYTTTICVEYYTYNTYREKQHLFKIDYGSIDAESIRKNESPEHHMLQKIVKDALTVKDILEMPISKIPLIMHNEEYSGFDILIKEVLKGSFC